MNGFYVACETLDRCPNCCGVDLRVWHKCYDRMHRLSQQAFTYSKCLKCGVVFLSFRPTESDVHKFYPADYGPYQQRGTEAVSQNGVPTAQRPTYEPLKSALLKAVRKLNSAAVRFSHDSFADEFEKFYRAERSGERLLDFGCGSDAFLNPARAQGWDTIGMDFSAETIEQVRRSGHQALLVSPAVWDEIEDESLELVRMNHVLEHLYNPTEVLAAVRSKMRPGAKLHIAVPNPDSLTSRLFRSRWFASEPRHVILYSPPVLKRLLEDAGFTDLRVRHETITKDFSRSLGYVLHDCGWISHVEVRQMMQRKGLAELLFTPARLAAFWGVADRFHVFARK